MFEAGQSTPMTRYAESCQSARSVADAPPPPIQVGVQRLQVNIDDLDSAVVRLMEKIKYVRADRPSPPTGEASGPNMGSSPVACQLNIASDRLRSMVRTLNTITDEIEL